MNQLATAIIKTLCYSDIFNFPLTRGEIYRRLISSTPYTRETIFAAIKTLNDNQTIDHTGPYYYLPGHQQIVTLRQGRQISSLPKYHRAYQVAAQLMHLPYVRAVFLTGAVAVNNAPENDDIDMMVITAKKSLWTCRLFVNIWLDLHRDRRHPGNHSVCDKICPNLFLTEEALKIDQTRQNLYTAYEIIQTRPLIDPHHLHDVFLAQNPWVRQFLPHTTIAHIPKSKHLSKSAPALIENLLRNLQAWYMKSKKTREITSPDTAYFHPRDTANHVRTQLSQRMRQYGYDY